MRRKLIAYLRERMGEASTWRGLILLAAVCGARLTPEQADALVLVGVGAAGLLGAVLPDGRK